MENNNGRGIFYGVIGVATLVIAIIGATFAFFAASETGNEISAGAANIGLNFVDSGVDYMKFDLIPVETGYEDEDGEYKQTGIAADAATTFANSEFVGAGACVDDQGYDICSIYEFTVTNTGTADLPISVNINTTNDIEHLKYAVFAGKATEITSWNVSGGTPVAAQTALASQNGELVIGTTAVPTTGSATFNKQLDVILEPSGDAQNRDEITYSVMIWIEEIGKAQSADGDFAGTVTVSTADGKGITGKLTRTSGSEG